MKGLTRRVLLQMPFFADEDGRGNEGADVVWDPRLYDDLNLAMMPMSLKMRQRLCSLGISRASQLAMMPPSRLLEAKNVGHVALEKLRRLLLALTLEGRGLPSRNDDLDPNSPERNNQPARVLVDWDN